MNLETDLQKAQNAIFEKLKQFISEIIGNDVAEELNITCDSVFTKDLEMDSIEIVAFAEKVKTEYGDSIDFTSWLSAMELDELINLSLGDIINFLYNALYQAKQN